VTRDHQWLIATTESPYQITVWNFQTGEYTNEKIFYDADGIYGLDRWLGTYAQTPHCLTVDNQWIMVVFNRMSVTSLNLPNLDRRVTLNSGNFIAWCAEGQNPKTTVRVVAVGYFWPCTSFADSSIEIWTSEADFSRLERIHLIQDTFCFYARVLTSDGRILIGAGAHSDKISAGNDHLKTETIIKIWDTSTGKLYNARTNSITNENE